MTITITAENGIEFEVCSLGVSIVDHEDQWKGWARLSPVQRRALADALAPERAEKAPAGGQWTRDDLPSAMDLYGFYQGAVYGRSVTARLAAAVDAVVEHLNTHHPRPPHPMGPEVATYRRERDEALRVKGEMVDRAVRAERERDAAVARADQLRDERDDAVQSCLVVGSERDEWKVRAEMAEARTAPLDPVVLVVGESDVEACQVRRRPEGSPYGGAGSWEAADQTWLYSKGVTVEELDEEIEVNLRGVIQALAVRRAIEAEQAVDPVEAKARELYQVGNPGTVGMWESIHEAFKDGYRRIARHVLGQEAGDE